MCASEIKMCENCEDKPAVVKTEGNDTFFCLECGLNECASDSNALWSDFWPIEYEPEEGEDWDPDYNFDNNEHNPRCDCCGIKMSCEDVCHFLGKYPESLNEDGESAYESREEPVCISCMEQMKAEKNGERVTEVEEYQIGNTKVRIVSYSAST